MSKPGVLLALLVVGCGPGRSVLAVNIDSSPSALHGIDHLELQVIHDGRTAGPYTVMVPGGALPPAQQASLVFAADLSGSVDVVVSAYLEQTLVASVTGSVRDIHSSGSYRLDLIFGGPGEDGGGGGGDLALLRGDGGMKPDLRGWTPPDLSGPPSSDLSTPAHPDLLSPPMEGGAAACGRASQALCNRVVNGCCTQPGAGCPPQYSISDCIQDIFIDYGADCGRPQFTTTSVPRSATDACVTEYTNSLPTCASLIASEDAVNGPACEAFWELFPPF